MADNVAKKAWGSDEAQVLEDIKNVMKSKRINVDLAIEELDFSVEEVEKTIFLVRKIGELLDEADEKEDEDNIIKQYDTLQTWHSKCYDLLVEINEMPYNKKISFADWEKRRPYNKKISFADWKKGRLYNKKIFFAGWKKRRLCNKKISFTSPIKRRSYNERNLFADWKERRSYDKTISFASWIKGRYQKSGEEFTDEENEYVKYNITGGIVALLFPYFSRAFKKKQDNDEYWNRSNDRANRRIRYENIPLMSQESYLVDEDYQLKEYEINVNFEDLTWAEQELYGWILDNIVENKKKYIKNQKWECIDLDKRKKLIEIINRLMDENWMDLQDMQEYYQDYFMDKIIEKLKFPKKFRIYSNIKELLKIVETIESIEFYKNNKERKNGINSEEGERDINGKKKQEILVVEYIEKKIQNLTEKVRKEIEIIAKKEENQLQNEMIERIKKRKPDVHIEELLEKNELLKERIMDIVRTEIPNIKETTLFGDEEFFKNKIDDRIKNKKKREQLLKRIKGLFIEKQKVVSAINRIMGEEEMIISIEKTMQLDEED